MCSSEYVQTKESTVTAVFVATINDVTHYLIAQSQGRGWQLPQFSEHNSAEMPNTTHLNLHKCVLLNRCSKRHHLLLLYDSVSSVRQCFVEKIIVQQSCNLVQLCNMFSTVHLNRFCAGILS